MAAVYSHRFISVNNASSDGTFTCPDAYVAVVVQMTGYVDVALPGSGTYVAANIDGTTIWHADQHGVSVTSTAYWATEGRWVLYPGETLYMSMGQTTDIYAGGYLLSD